MAVWNSDVSSLPRMARTDSGFSLEALAAPNCFRLQKDTWGPNRKYYLCFRFKGRDMTTTIVGLVSRQNGRDHDLCLMVVVHLCGTGGLPVTCHLAHDNGTDGDTKAYGVMAFGLEAALSKADVSCMFSWCFFHDVQIVKQKLPQSHRALVDSGPRLGPAWWSPNMSSRPPSCICISGCTPRHPHVASTLQRSSEAVPDLFAGLHGSWHQCLATSATGNLAARRWNAPSEAKASNNSVACCWKTRSMFLWRSWRSSDIRNALFNGAQAPEKVRSKVLPWVVAHVALDDNDLGEISAEGASRSPCAVESHKGPGW